MTAAKRSAPAALRNRAAIAAALEGRLPGQGTVLEIASGTGEHVAYFAGRFPTLHWQPSDLDEDNLASIKAWAAEAEGGVIRPPLRIDVGLIGWSEPLMALTPPLSALYCANMIHIASWTAVEGLFKGAERLLAPGGPIILYGPYRRHGRHTAPSNEAFDLSLKSRDPRWGVRDLDGEVAPLAEAHGFAIEDIVEMPANNLTVVFRRI